VPRAAQARAGRRGGAPRPPNFLSWSRRKLLVEDSENECIIRPRRGPSQQESDIALDVYAGHDAHCKIDVNLVSFCIAAILLDGTRGAVTC
jgi:hypothetical protein